MLLKPLIIKTINHCISCTRYIEPSKKYRHVKLGQCSMFGKQHLVTGKIVYKNAIDCRNCDRQCGESGRYYRKKAV